MSERPYVSTIKQMLKETRELEGRGPRARARSCAAGPPAAPDQADADLALLDEIETGLEEGTEEGLEGPGDAAGGGAAAAADDEAGAAEPRSPAGRPGRRLRAARAGQQAPGDRPIGRLLRLLGDLQERRAATMASGRRPARMFSPALMKEAAGQQVDPSDPVAQRRRKQIQEFRAAWIESLNLRPTPAAATPAAEPKAPAAEAQAPATGSRTPAAEAGAVAKAGTTGGRGGESAS